MTTSIRNSVRTPGGSASRSSNGQIAGAPLRNYVLAIAACALATLIAAPLSERFDLANIVMLFLLAVFLVATRLGRGPSVMAAVLSVALFDFFFVPPRFTFSVYDAQYLLTFAIMLIVALVAAHLTANLHQQAQVASMKERRAHALYEMARELAGALTLEQVNQTLRGFVHDALQTDAVVLLKDPDGQLHSMAGAASIPSWVDPKMAELASQDTTCTDLDSMSRVAYFPLLVSRRVCGVLAVRALEGNGALLAEQAELLDTVASLVSIVVERVTKARGGAAG